MVLPMQAADGSCHRSGCAVCFPSFAPLYPTHDAFPKPDAAFVIGRGDSVSTHYDLLHGNAKLMTAVAGEAQPFAVVGD